MDELRELTELFTAHGLTDFEFENADIRIRLSRNPAAVPAPGPTPQAALHSAASQGAPQPVAQGAAESAATKPAPPAAPEAPEEELHIVTSPIVGTFYRAPSPNDDPFVKVGSQVENDSVVCIIEAMKLMNEIQAETAGTVAKIYVENGQPVEYGQPLFGVKK
jgi:acetyl-CoA carboxylase biotin carboxyl carrier protein